MDVLYTHNSVGLIFAESYETGRCHVYFGLTGRHLDYDGDCTMDTVWSIDGWMLLVAETGCCVLKSISNNGVTP